MKPLGPTAPPKLNRVIRTLAVAAALDENRRYLAGSLEKETRSHAAYRALPLHAAKLQVIVELLEVEATKLGVA